MDTIKRFAERVKHGEKKAVIVSALILEVLIIALLFLFLHPTGENLYRESGDISLPKGSYTLQLSYSVSEEGAAYLLLAPESEFADLAADTSVALSPALTQIHQHFYVNYGIDKLEISFLANETDLQIESVELYENWDAFGKSVFLSLLVVTLLAFALCSRSLQQLYKDNESRKIGILLLFVIFVSSIPLFTNYLMIYDGQDTYYHLTRIEGIKEGLLCGQFPVRNNAFSYNGYGHILPVFYPDLFLYIPALLRIIGFSVMGAYKLFLFGVNIAATMIAYFCFKRLFRDRWIGLLGSMLYVLSSYRFTNLYMRGALGEALAMTFLPLVLVGMYEVLFGNCKSKQYKQSYLLLVAGFTGVLQCHLLSFEMCVIFSFLVVVLFLRRTLQRSRLWMLVKGTAITMVLNAGFLVPLIYFMGRYADMDSMATASLQEHGTYLAQLLLGFPDVSGESYWVGWGLPGDLPLNIGIPFVVGVFLFFVFKQDKKGCRARKYRRLGQFFVFMGMLALYMTTYYFPWGKIGRAAELLDTIVSIIQFPWRFLAPATVFFTVVVCAAMYFAMGEDENRRKVFMIGMALLCFVSVTAFSGELMKNARTVRIYDECALDSFSASGGIEYLPAGTDTQLFQESTQVRCSEGIELTDYVKKGTTVELTLENETDTAQTVLLPLINYEGYGVTAKGNGSPQIENGANNCVQLVIPAGFAGEIRVTYAGYWWIRLCDVITVVTAIVLLYPLLRERIKRRPVA